jgi:integrase
MAPCQRLQLPLTGRRGDAFTIATTAARTARRVVGLCAVGQTLLGHSSPVVTLTIYAHLMPAEHDHARFAAGELALVG